jgi:7-dehydrocholesterol reductase
MQYEMNGQVADSMLVNTALMLIYITKFFWWESGYWCTMDIAHDRGRKFIYLFNGNCDHHFSAPLVVSPFRLDTNST